MVSLWAEGSILRLSIFIVNNIVGLCVGHCRRQKEELTGVLIYISSKRELILH